MIDAAELTSTLDRWARPLSADEVRRRAEATGSGSSRPTRRRRPLRATATAAALVAVAALGLGLWSTLRSDSTEVATEPAPAEPAEPTVLLPDPDRWGMVGASEMPAGRSSGQGLWAWRVDSKLVTLVDGFEATDPLAEAPAETSANRVVLAWRDERTGAGLGFQGIDVTVAELREIADRLEPTDAGWSLPGADVVAVRGESGSPAGQTRQSDFVEIGPDGVPDLSPAVTSSTRPGDTADLLGELFDASSLGMVTERMIAGSPGFLVTGGSASYAVVERDGQITTIQTGAPDVELGAFLDDLAPVSVETWELAVDEIETTREAAIEAELADLDEEAAPSPSADELPRYVLPAPSGLIDVTDFGLWTDEQRARREAEVRAEGTGGPDVLRSQGFRLADGSDDLPVEVPDLVITVVTPRQPDPGTAAEGYTFPDRLGPLPARIEDFDSGVVYLTAHDDDLTVGIQASGVTGDELREIAAELVPRDGDPALGFDTSRPDIDELFDLGGDEARNTAFDAQWRATWIDDDRQITVTATRLTPAQYQRTLAFRLATPGSRLDALDNGDLVLTIDEQVLDEVGIELFSFGTHLFRYDGELLVTVTVPDERDAAAALAVADSLMEVALDDWTEVAGPVNVRP